MTENKRFTVETFIDDYLCGFKDLEGNECEIRYDGKPMTYREVTDLLNELAEEKEYYQIKSGKCEEELLKLRRDNEQLKHDATVLICSNQEYRKKNEQLKKQLSEAKADEKQLGISFMGYKMKLIEVLQKKYDKVKGKTLYADVYTEIAEEMGVDLE